MTDDAIRVVRTVLLPGSRGVYADCREGGFRPGDKIAILPAADFDQMVTLLEEVRPWIDCRSTQNGQVVADKITALLSRLGNR